MASHRGHIITGVLFGMLLLGGLALSPLARNVPIHEMLLKGVIILWLAIMFALFPDVDIKSKGQALFYRIFFVLDLVLLINQYVLEAALLGFVALLPIISKHRGWTHTYPAMLFIPAPILVAPMVLAKAPVTDGLPFYLGAVAGYFSHLVADGMLFRQKKH